MWQFSPGWLPLNGDQLLEAFEIYDHDGSGHISPAEMEKAISLVMGSGVVGQEQVKRVLDRFPPEGISFDAFVELYTDCVVGTDGLASFRDALNSFDETGEGRISKETFADLFCTCSDVDTPREKLDSLFQELDSSDSGGILVEDFMKYLSWIWTFRIAENVRQNRSRRVSAVSFQQLIAKSPHAASLERRPKAGEEEGEEAGLEIASSSCTGGEDDADSGSSLDGAPMGRRSTGRKSTGG
ncbi:unnamed protein product, partial [Prorocentrum cordatum]